MKAILMAIGGGFTWFLDKFIPWIVKKFGLGVVKFSIQNVISIVLYTVVIAFWTASVYFITATYAIFREFIDLISNPTANTQFGSSTYLECFMSLLQASGIASGFNAAISFTMMILLFMFTLAVYNSATVTVKRISDEVFKSLNFSF